MGNPINTPLQDFTLGYLAEENTQDDLVLDTGQVKD